MSRANSIKEALGVVCNPPRRVVDWTWRSCDAAETSAVSAICLLTAAGLKKEFMVVRKIILWLQTHGAHELTRLVREYMISIAHY